MYTVAFETLGCRLNQAETAILQNRFLSRGYTLADAPEIADLYVLHTCTLTATRTLAYVVKALTDIEGLACVRLSSIEPTTIEEELDEMARGSKLCPYLHVPLQSGDSSARGSRITHQSSKSNVRREGHRRTPRRRRFSRRTNRRSHTKEGT